MGATRCRLSLRRFRQQAKSKSTRGWTDAQGWFASRRSTESCGPTCCVITKNWSASTRSRSPTRS